MRVLITGAAGFIGTRLFEWMRDDDRYKAMVLLDKADMGHLRSPYATKIKHDITNELKLQEISRLLRDLKVKACVHLAAIAAPRLAATDQKLAWDTNVRGTQNVLTLLREAGIRKIVFASSAHVYGISPRYMPTDENHPLALHDTYTTTKIVGEQLCHLFHTNYGLSPTILRLFNAYGPGQSQDYFIGAKIKQAMSGKTLTLMNGDVTKDWVWVEDVVDAIVKAIHTEYVGPINIGTGVETSLKKIAEQIACAFGVDVNPDPTVDDSPTRMRCNPERAIHTIDWKSKITIQDGIGRIIEHTR